MKSIRRSLFGMFTLAALGLVLVLATTMTSRSADDDRGIVSSLLSRVLSTPTSRVSIGSVQGALLSDSTINDISIADRDGVWLQVDRVRFNWRRTALLLRRLEIDKLEIGTIKILRKPLPNEQVMPTPDAPILPELPLKVVITDFSLKELAMGETVIGTAARLSATGAATIGNPAEGLNLRFDARRLDAPGQLIARLDLVPSTQKLDLKLDVDEPAGGVLAYGLNIPGQPPVKLDLNGTGTLDAFNANLTFNAGPNIGANGSAQLQRQNDTRRLTLALAAQIEGLLPSIAAPVFAGTTQLNGNVIFADSSAITISPLTVTSQTARLDINGGLTSDQVADLKVSVRSLPNAGDKTAAADTEVGKLNFDASIAGPIAGPKIDATLDAERVKIPQGEVRKISAKFNAAPNGDVTVATTATPFTATAQVEGLAPADQALARALGNAMTLTLAGTLTDGVADLQTGRLQTPTAALQLTGKVGGKLLQAKAVVNAADLSRFGDLASLQLRGGLTMNADLTGVPNAGRIEAVIDGQATRFGTGVAAIDGLAGGRVDLKGAVSKLSVGGYSFSDLRLTGVHATARIDGQATTEMANITARVTVPDLKRADDRLSGRAELGGTVTGNINQPNAEATLTVTDARAMGRPVPRLTVNISAADLTGLIDARATLNGTVDTKPAQGVVRVAKQANGQWMLSDLDLRVGSVTAKGAVTLNENQLATGNVSINAGNLDDLSPLVLTKLSGQLSADTTLAVVDNGQNGTLSARANDVKFGASSLDRLAAQLQVTDLYRRPRLAGDVTVNRARIAGEDISEIRLSAKPNADASDITLTARARGSSVDAEAKLAGTLEAPTGSWKLRVDNLVLPQTRDAGLPPLDIAGSGVLADRRTTVDGTIGAKGAGNIRINGTVPFQGDGIDLRAQGNINIGAANRFLAGAGRSVAGKADIDFKIGGSLTKPTADGAATISGGSYSDILLGLRYTNINGRIAARGNDIRVERLSAQTPNGGTITAQGDVAIDPEAGFPGNIRISAQRAKLVENDIFSMIANLSLSLSGPLARNPTINGKIDVVTLDVTVPERLPANLRPIEGTRHVAPPPAVRARLAAQARAKARAGRGPAFNANVDLTISAPNRVFVRGRGIDAELGGDLRLRGRLSDLETVGAFDLRRGRISVAGTSLDFTQGRIQFTGDLTPDLNFVAQTRTSDVTAIVTISGPAREPSFTFSSDPDLPQDEVLSRLLFSKASGGLSAIQALQLAQVASQFSGGGGNDVFERVRKSLGVDSLDVSVGANGGPTVGISRAINRRLSVGVKTGSDASDSGVSVDFDVTRNVRLKGEANADGGAAVGVGVEWDY